MLAIDHVILGVSDRDAATRRIELLGVVDRREAEGVEFGRMLLHWVAGGNCLTRWCFQTDDLAAVVARVGLTPEARGRRRPDGVKLTWRAAGLANSLKETALPGIVVEHGVLYRVIDEHLEAFLDAAAHHASPPGRAVPA